MKMIKTAYMLSPQDYLSLPVGFASYYCAFEDGKVVDVLPYIPVFLPEKELEAAAKMTENH